MSFEPPAGILDIGNATLRVGKLEVAETSGLNQGLQNIIKNDLLITENTEYFIDHHWGLKLPTTWVAEFEVKGHTGKYIDFNFYNENSASNAQGYNLTFMDTTMTLRYDGGNPLGGGAATIPTIVGAFRKVNIFFERGVISVSIDGTRYLYHKESDGFNQNLGVASRVVSTTGSAFVNLFIEQNAADSAFKNLRIVNGRFISDKTSNIAFIGGNLGVGVNSPQEALDIRGNMHLTRVSNVSQIKVESNVVAEYTGPHDRPYRKYPEVAMTANDNSSTSGYVASISSGSSTYDAWKCFNGTIGGDDWDNWLSDALYASATGDATVSGAASTTVSGVSGAVIGEWVQLKLPKPICLKDLALAPMMYSGTQYATGRTPTKGVIVGSIDGTNWELVHSFTAAGLQSFPQNYYASSIGAFNSSKYYDYFRLIIEEVTGGTNGDRVALGEVCFYGYEEGDSSLDTTLKTVYNVPATTGTQLEVYYDAKGESTVQSPIPDLSPNTNTGAVSGHSPTLDSTDGIDSFKFDASSSQNITSTIDTSYWGTNKLHSVAFWFKADTINGKFNIFHIGNPAASESSGFWISDGSADSNSGNSLSWWFYGGDSTLKTSSFSWALDTWYHIALTFDGSTKKLYVNGKHTDYSVGNVITTLPTGIPASASLAVGSTTNSVDYFDGSIANFRVYGAKVLNADQIKELYDYQKDYFLGSKSQVTLYKGHLGVGVTEPSGQLELAGDERIQEYPPRAMTGYETLVEGHGVFCASASRYYNNVNHLPWQAFTPAATSGAADGWNSGDNSTGTGLGYYAETASGEATSAAALFEGTRGEWVQLKCPYPIIVKKFAITGRSNGVYGGSPEDQPKSGILYGSNDGNNWDSLANFSGLTYGGASGGAGASGGTEHVEVNATKGYTRLVLQATARVTNYGTDDWINIGQLKFFGTPGPTTLDKGSLTLGRSLDVPRVSRYDVDTETPRPEKLVVDFDTTVNSSPTDISGKGNHGVFNGTNMNYSSADKAFVFNGTDDYIEGTRPTSLLGNVSYTIALWVKFDTITTNNYDGLVEIGDRATNTTSGTFPSIFVYHGANLGFYFSNGGGIVTSGVLPVVGRWYHLVGVYDQGSNKGHFYIDGGTTFTGSGTPANTTNIISTASVFLGGDSTANSGQYLDGQISNPKIYDVALEPSEVKKLYRLGRTGRSMVISDTAVGIGKVPEAQLDVRGAIRGVNMTTCPVYFDVSWSGTQATNTNILFNVFHVRHGGAFAEGQSREFYAPITGHYYFSFYGMGTFISGNNQTWVTLRRNGSDANLPNGVSSQRIYDNYNSNGDAAQQHRQISGAAMIAMNAGDYMQLHVEGGNAIHGYYGRFQGFFLSPY